MEEVAPTILQSHEHATECAVLLTASIAGQAGELVVAVDKVLVQEAPTSYDKRRAVDQGALRWKQNLATLGGK